MRYGIPIRRLWLATLATASVVLLIALVAVASDGGIVVNTGTREGPAIDATTPAIGSSVAGKFFGDWGVLAFGREKGIEASCDTGVGGEFRGYRGVRAFGEEYAGRFENDLNFVEVKIGELLRGMYVQGDSGVGGEFHGDKGIEAFGETHAARFGNSLNSVEVTIAQLLKGIYADGVSGVGGEFHGDKGIEAYGSTEGGYFKDSDDSGYARVGYGDNGINAHGNNAGGYFEDSNNPSYAYVAFEHRGIEAFGSSMGGHFQGSKGIEAYGASSAWADVATSSYKINGTGTVNFVQNHPYDPFSVIVYTAPEGDEAATYTRGSAKLLDGEATVPLGETFKWVTNPDIGLTAFLTPVNEWCDLYIAEQATDSIVVRSRDGSDCSFNYLVYGLRIGFEETSVVQEKEREAYIPSMSDHRELYQRRPDLRRYNALERYKGLRHAGGKSDELDLSRASALRDAIIEFDPAVHELPTASRIDEMAEEGVAGGDVGGSTPVRAGERVGNTRSHSDRPSAPGHTGFNGRIPVDDDGNIYASSFRPSSRDVASLVDVSEAVEPGDVLVIDRDNPGMMRPGFEAHDAAVIGVVSADAGLMLGSPPPRSTDEEEATAPFLRAAIALAGVVDCKVDADYGSVWPGDLLVTSPTPGHAMRTDSPLPGTMIGKALEPLKEGTGKIRVLVMLR